MKPNFSIFLISAGLITLGLSACAPDQSSRRACLKTVSDYAWLRDDPAQSEAYAELFTENGTFVLAGQVTEGRAALMARHRTANQNAVWRHNMTASRIEVSDTKITGKTRFIIQTGPRASGVHATSPVPVAREIIGYYEDEFALVAGQCRLDSRRVHIEFDSFHNLKKD